MAPALQPSCEDEVRVAVAEALAVGRKLVVRGGGSKADMGAPTPEATTLDMRGLAGIVDYDPAELVLTVRPGTPLVEVATLLEGRNQMLAFEPFDHGPIFGRAAGAATIGGVVAAGVAGSQRLSQGAPRDHLLGFRAVSGRGEAFVGGGKVVKNVTGYDLPKLMAGSWGRLSVLTELTLKVLPRPRDRVTRVVYGLAPAPAIDAMASALASQAEVAAAAHLPAEDPARSRTLFRLQGFGPSVAARCDMLERRLAALGRVEPLPPDEADRAWTALRTLAPLGEAPLWRINVPPSGGRAVLDALVPLGARWLLDWAGGLVWIAVEERADAIRAAAAAAGGHAALIRAPEAMRRVVPALHPQPQGIAALEARIRRAFDPGEVFETGRF